MACLFRSRSCSLGALNLMPPVNSSPNCPSLYEDEDDEEDENEGYFGDFHSDDDDDSDNLQTMLFISPTCNARDNKISQPQFSVLAVVAATLRRSLVTCTVDADDVASDVDIGWPKDVRLVSHVTFDRFNGFLGLPVELQLDVPRKPPSGGGRPEAGDNGKGLR